VLRKLGEVEPGAEVIAVGTEHDRADAARRRGKHRLETEQGGVVQRVAFGDAIEPHDQHGPVALRQDRRGQARQTRQGTVQYHAPCYQQN
jgi:hypothetical protein